MSEYRPHRIEWTPDRVAHLWQYYGTSPAYAHAYFSMHSGASVLELVSKHVRLNDVEVLDFGCGRGHMLQHLLTAGVACRGLEFSRESADEAQRNVGRHPRFRGVVWSSGVPTPLEDASADVVFMVEVIEHLFADQLLPTLHEVHRILRPGGSIVVTTPHAEDLEASMLHCPECGSTFHRWQHMRSFTASSLSDLMATAGFTRHTCEATCFKPSAEQTRPIVRALRAAYRKLQGRRVETPHLAYIGQKQNLG